MDIQRPVSKQPIPSHANKVFKGVIFDVWQWEQELYDGTTTTFEKLKRPDTVNVIPITPEGKIILSKQEQPGVVPFTGVLGGRVDPGETPTEAVKRELLEESGYEAQEYILWHALQPIEKIDWAIYTFIAKGVKRVQDPELEGGEKIELLHLSFKEFIDVTTQKNFRDPEIEASIAEAQRDPEKFEELQKLFAV